LFEKQRVIDPYLEEHEEDNLILHGYYQNNYSKAKMNKHVKYIYQNTYNLSHVRFQLFASTFSTALATAALGMIHPALCGMMLYDYYLLAAFSTQILNKTVHSLMMHPDKMHVIMNRCNFMGFETEARNIALIRNIDYRGEVKNEYLSFEYTGLPPSIAKLMNMTSSELKKDDRGDVQFDSIKEEERGNF